MQTTTTCSWCHHLNDAGQRSCDGCGHDAHVPRTRCRCSACTVTLPIGDSGHTITIVARDAVQHRERRRETAPVKRATKIDYLQHGLVLQYFVYFDLVNWPKQYVVREFNGASMDGGPLWYRSEPLAIADDLAAVRRAIPGGYINVGRHDGDPACIVEIWV